MDVGRSGVALLDSGGADISLSKAELSEIKRYTSNSTSFIFRIFLNRNHLSEIKVSWIEEEILSKCVDNNVC